MHRPPSFWFANQNFALRPRSLIYHRRKNAREFAAVVCGHIRYGFICFGWGRERRRSILGGVAAAAAAATFRRLFLLVSRWLRLALPTYLPTYTNLIDTRPVSSRFDSPLPLSLRDGDEDVTPSRTGSSTGSFASQPRSNRSIALRSVLRIPPVDLPPRTRLRNYRT